jgi:hypothetical protein
MDFPSETPEDQKEMVEHRDALLDIRAILKTASGKNFVKYLFKTLGAAELPEIGLPPEMLMDKLGFMRAGNSVFKLVAEADADEAGKLLAITEKERHAKLYAQEHEIR